MLLIVSRRASQRAATLAVLGMSNPLVIVAGAAVILAYKLIPWPLPTFPHNR